MNGRDLGGVNLTHLVELASKEIALSELTEIKDAFYELFDSEKIIRGISDEKGRKVAAALLYYGSFWHRISPWYYENYHLGDWRRTVRGQGDREKQIAGHRTIFSRFFDEYRQSRQTLDEFLLQKQGSVPVDPVSERDLRNALIWYSEKLGKRLFGEGMFIAKETGMEKGADANFPNIPILWNTQGNFRGYSNTKLADLVRPMTA
ncbi:MAG: hypothetical protein ACOYM3_08390 [Terrimicrobiaceae bacterium]